MGRPESQAVSVGETEGRRQKMVVGRCLLVVQIGPQPEAGVNGPRGGQTGRSRRQHREMGIRTTRWQSPRGNRSAKTC